MMDGFYELITPTDDFEINLGENNDKSVKLALNMLERNYSFSADSEENVRKHAGRSKSFKWIGSLKELRRQ